MSALSLGNIVRQNVSAEAKTITGNRNTKKERPPEINDSSLCYYLGATE